MKRIFEILSNFAQILENFWNSCICWQDKIYEQIYKNFLISKIFWILFQIQTKLWFKKFSNFTKIFDGFSNNTQIFQNFWNIKQTFFKISKCPTNLKKISNVTQIVEKYQILRNFILEKRL